VYLLSTEVEGMRNQFHQVSSDLPTGRFVKRRVVVFVSDFFGYPEESIDELVFLLNWKM